MTTRDAGSPRPFNAAAPSIGELIDASSLGTPGAKALREAGRRLLSGEESLTGMPEEQADWDADDAVDLATQCGECVPDGYGPPCTGHFLDADHEFARGLDR